MKPAFKQTESKRGARLYSMALALGVVLLTVLACSLPATRPSDPAEIVTVESPTESPIAESPTSTVPQVSIQTIMIHAGIDVSQPSQSPRYLLKAHQGHYLLYVFETQKLIYDGQEIPAGEMKDPMCPLGLSNNGVHYAYAGSSESGSNFSDLYVDGQKINNIADLSCPTVTNDAQHYFYTACKNDKGVTGTCLFKDGKDVFDHADGFIGYWISGDGSAYLASLRNIDSSGAFVESLVLNGNEVYKGGELKDTLFSDNGQHYAYISVDPTTHSQALVVDGNAKHSSTALFVDQLTNAGSFCGWDSAQKTVFINDKAVPVTNDSDVQCYINENASHLLLHDNGWTLDAQPVQLENVADADFVGEELYIYSVVQ